MLQNEDKPLMKRLLDAGYPKDEMYHHESDLYIFVTPLTAQIVTDWCKEHGYNKAIHCAMFLDQLTGKWMYECGFQYMEVEQ